MQPDRKSLPSVPPTASNQQKTVVRLDADYHIA
jgi:hypothetical protein